MCKCTFDSTKNQSYIIPSNALVTTHYLLTAPQFYPHTWQLYDRGTLNSRNSNRFDKTNRNEDGKGSIRDAKKKSDMYCAKLESIKFVGMKGEFDVDEDVETEFTRTLRGGI